jgi:hypothetical protein
VLTHSFAQDTSHESDNLINNKIVRAQDKVKWGVGNFSGFLGCGSKDQDVSGRSSDKHGHGTHDLEDHLN